MAFKLKVEEENIQNSRIKIYLTSFSLIFYRFFLTILIAFL
ncbi:hypothetical protein pah_c207o038 [Parachlamydia acanthamoebae str. Hall's coccus]|nr:hypothetical protein pah_c207o038 [Parachlamydia acanthamoebae str. Hall's coccus]